jgi:hypothetical protein
MMLTMGAYVGWKNRFEAGIVISTIFHPPTRVTLVLIVFGLRALFTTFIFPRIPCVFLPNSAIFDIV